jgi:hypothetical protein
LSFLNSETVHLLNRLAWPLHSSREHIIQRGTGPDM